MSRPRHVLALLIGMSLALTACGGGVSYEEGAASATLELPDGGQATFDGGTCEAADGTFIVRIGDSDEGVGIRLGGVDPDGGTVDGNPDGHGVQVDHGEERWGMADGPDALVFASGGESVTVQLQGITRLGSDHIPDPAVVTVSCT